MAQFTTGQFLGGLLVIGLLIIGGIMVGSGRFAITGEDAELPTTPTSIVEAGKNADLKVATFNAEADTATQVAISSGFYVWEGDTLTVNAETMLSNARENVDTATGSTLTMIAFDSTYNYAEATTFAMNRELDNLNIDVHAGVGTSDLSVKFYADGDNVSSVALGASEVKSLDKITLKLNTNNKAYVPGLLLFNLVDATNVSDINVKGLTEVAVPQRVKNDYDYAFELSHDMMSEWDILEINSIELRADSDGVSSENLTVGFADYAPFIGTDQSLKYGYEDDQSSPADVGISDKTAILSLT